MNNFAIDLYRQMFLSMRRGYAIGSPSMAKPILLVSLIETVPSMKQNIFNLDNPVLNECYITNSKVMTKQRVPSIIVPYFHMRTEPFYDLLWKSDSRPLNYPHTPSRKVLTPLIEGAKFDDELWILLQNDKNRDYLHKCVISHYFSQI